MSKKHTSLNIDEEVLIEAKKKGWILSEIAEDALRNKLGKKDVEIDESIENCEFCGKKDEKTNYLKNTKGLFWLYPDEKWICESCLKAEGRFICKG